MRLVVVAVGARMPAWVDAAFEQYRARMPREARVELIEVKPEKRAVGIAAERVLGLEAERIRAALPRGCVQVALDQRGRAWSSAELAAALGAWRQDGRDVGFMIGGADGLASALKARADMRLSLSALTLPHALARVVLAEQLYRAHTILSGHPYHRA
ncbi:MAG: 23S rRNA (pseudouridine(1915)-N(3))-methyltransferase RlmH [Burkholderiales bacterium]|nr:23S rRNA (pseudouridine(1915)-N(3))-methyltransferase RlmH [Burkholderiales bacterium]